MEANTYGIVPFFCNKVEPMIQYVHSDLNNILNFLNTSLGIIDIDILSALDNDFGIDMGDDDEIRCNPRPAIIEKINSHSGLGVVLQVRKGFIPKSKLLELFYILSPEYIYDHVMILIVRFDVSIVNVWKEVQEICYP